MDNPRGSSGLCLRPSCELGLLTRKFSGQTGLFHPVMVPLELEPTEPPT
jgi:hypothetical protein